MPSRLSVSHLRQLLADDGRPARAATQFDLDRGSSLVMRFMRRFHDRCAERALPALDCLVVQADGARRGYPGGGYFAVNGHEDPFSDRTRPEKSVAALAFWQADVRRCREWAARSRPEPRRDDPTPTARNPL